MLRRSQTMLSVALAGDVLPTEFRIFSAGKNETVKGTFVFDDAAAKSVMAEYQAHGIDVMLDYDHASLDVGTDPALSGKAAGWINLELRNGELWAVNVRWTQPAADALLRKEWRFMSPAFQTEGDRIVSLLNVAITNLPATRRLEPLMAASLTTLGATGMDAALVKKALDAITAGDAEACSSILKDMIASAAGGGEPATEDEPAVEEMAEATPSEEEEDKAAVVAATSRLTRIAGKTSLTAAVEEAEIWRMKALKSDEVLAQVAKERAVLELSKRKENALAFTRLGAETSHTTGLATGKLCKRLAEEPLDEQNERLAALLAARGGKLPEAPKTPVTASLGAAGLSESELAHCKATGCEPATFARLKAGRTRNGV